MTDFAPLSHVDAGDFRGLFIDNLGWNNPDRPPLHCELQSAYYELTQVAGYRGLRIWVCNALPDRKAQREIDKQVGQDNLERLVIFVGAAAQEWRWPRRAQTGGVNAKLLMHRHLIGQPDPHLDEQLRAIQIDFDAAPTLVELLSRMRVAFDRESESASVQAARLMGALYGELELANVSPADATLLLARLLFLLFGDDSGMWEKDVFHDHLIQHTSDAELHRELSDLFDVLNRDAAQRGLPAESPLARFRYINGGLFRDRLDLPPLTSGFRGGLLKAGDFDWQIISPAIFGSMFQTVKDKEARRESGEHYTSEQNILRTIGPLFLDELQARLQSAWDDKGQLTKLHGDLGKIRFLDPACGCGNFLVIAYRELRALELELLKRRRDLDEADGRRSGRDLSQRTFDVTGEIKVTLDHFFGIEIEPWPARIAETAMLIVDHLANQRMEEDFGIAPDRLPIRVAPTIVQGNALDIDWETIISPDHDVIIAGNPPFVGQKEKTASQTADMRRVWGGDYHGYMDYVTAWFRKACSYLVQPTARFAFVATSSISQGLPVAATWAPLLADGWRIFFAHRPFNWTSETTGKAGVHVVIIGMTRNPRPAKFTLFDYPPSGDDSSQQIRTVKRISPYLIEAPDTLVRSSRSPLSDDLPTMTEGSKLWDFGHLVVLPDVIQEFEADPIAAKYIRPLLSNTTMLKGTKRWVLWLKNSSADERARSPLIKQRLDLVTAKRLASDDLEANKKAATPHLFTNDRQPGAAYLAIPKVTGHAREYLPTAYSDPDVIVNNTLFTAVDPDGFIFALVSSRLFTTWQRIAGGHTRADTNFSNTLVWNTFPMPAVDARTRAAIVSAGRSVLAVRAAHLRVASLESIYEGARVPQDLTHAHAALDELVAASFGMNRADAQLEERRQTVLLARYADANTSHPRP